MEVCTFFINNFNVEYVYIEFNKYKGKFHLNDENFIKLLLKHLDNIINTKDLNKITKILLDIKLIIKDISFSIDKKINKIFKIDFKTKTKIFNTNLKHIGLALISPNDILYYQLKELITCKNYEEIIEKALLIKEFYMFYLKIILIINQLNSSNINIENIIF